MITPLSAPFLCWDINSQSYFLCSYHSPLFSPGEGVPTSAISSSCRVSALRHRGHVNPQVWPQRFWWGGGDLDPPTSSRSGSVPSWTVGPERRGPWASLPAGLCSCPAPWQLEGRFAGACFQSPVLIFSCSPAFPFSYCIFVINSLMARENSSEPSPSHKYACASPEPFSAPSLPLTQVGGPQGKGFSFHPETSVSASAWQFHSTRPHLPKPTSYQFSFLPGNLIPSHC